MKNLNVKIFADGADKKGILEMNEKSFIKGFTTNPTLMKRAGIKDYKNFCLDILKYIGDKSISFEVFSDDFDEMEKQALEIASWGENIYVKIPITNSKGHSSNDLARKLTNSGVKLNVTAIFTSEQIKSVLPSLENSKGAYVSVFAGRIADSGIDPLPVMQEVMSIIKPYPQIELIWASPRELYNVIQANDIGCHIITATNAIINKLPTIGKDLNQFSIETVKMFYDDAKLSGYKI